MAEGYFNDGTVNIELGAHVFALPAGARRNLTLEAPSQPAAVLDSGGGVLSLEVTGQRARANRATPSATSTRRCARSRSPTPATWASWTVVATSTSTASRSA